MRNSVLPTSSIEMKTDRFTSYSHYAKAGLIFATTTATYFLAKATGVLPSWFWGSETSSPGEPRSTALTVPESSSLVIEESPVEVIAFSKPSEFVQESGVFTPGITDFQAADLTSPVWVDSAEDKDSAGVPAEGSSPFEDSESRIITVADEEVVDSTLIPSTRRRLLQQTAPVTVIKPIPNQWADVDQLYEYALNEVFTEGYTLLGVTQANGSSLPGWLSINAVIGNYDTPGDAQGVAVSGSTAFVVDWNGGLQIVDVSTPDIPRLLNSYYIPSEAVGVAVSGSTVWIAGGEAGLQIVNVSNISAPRLLGSYDTPGEAYGVAVSGSIVFVADGSAGLQIVNVSNTSAPRLLGSYDTPGDAWGVAVLGSTVFVADGYTGELLVVDVSNTSAPRLLRSYGVLTDAWGVAVLGSTVLVADDTSGLQIVDVSNASAPRLLGRYDTPGDAWGVAVSGGTVFVADGTAGLQIVDPRQGKLIGTPSLSNLGQQTALTVYASNSTSILANISFILTVDQLPYLLQTTVSDQRVFPGDRLSLLLNSQLFVNPGGSFLSLSVQSRNQEKIEWLTLSLSPSVRVGGYYRTGGTASDVVVSGSTVFIADGSAGLQIVDVSIPSAPRLLGNYNTPGGACDVAVSGKTVLVADDMGGLQIVDVSNTSAPHLLSNYTTSHAVGVAVSGSTVFLADSTAGLQIVDVSNTSAPRWLGSYDTPGDAQGVAVLGSTVFVADGSAGLQIVDVSNTSAPRWLGGYNTPGEAQGVAVSGSTVFVADKFAGLQIVDVSIPSAPRWLSRYGASDTVRGVTVLGSTVFVADGSAGLQIVDVSNTSAPRLLGNYNTPNDAHGVTVSGSMVLVADWSGLRIADVSQWQLIATPQAGDVRNYAVQLIATDALGGSVSADFIVRVEGPPRINGTILQQYAKVGQAFNYFIPQGLITDPNFDTISFSAREQNNSSLPAWLGFNGISAIFVGVPKEEDTGNLTIILSATDHIAGTMKTTFGLLVDHLPVVTHSIPAQVADIGLPYDYIVPNTTFFEPDGYPMSYSAQQSNRLPLPGWLSFNSTTRQFQGQPNLTHAGTYSIAVIVKDDYQGQAKTDFVLIVEHFPRVNQWLTAPLAGVGIPFHWEMSSNIFEDWDNDPLTYSARQSSGLLLPNWLSFNPQTLIFSGVPLETDQGMLPLQMIATDPAGASVKHNFTIQIIHFPTLAHPQSMMMILAGESFHLSLPPDTFTDVDQAGLAYSIEPSLPSWLSFDNRSLSFSGATSPPGATPLTLVATDQRGAQVRMDFQLVAREKAPPTALVSSLSNQAATVGRAFSYFPPLPLFADAYNNTLRYSALQQEGLPLPLWLNFNNKTFHFSGTPGRGDTNFYAIRTVGVKIVAQSREGQASTSFNIMVDGVSWGQLAISIGAPLASLLTTLYALYEYRALLLNYWNRKKYTRLENKQRDTIIRGQPFTYPLFNHQAGDRVKSSDVHLIHAGIPDKRAGCCRFFKADARPLPGGERLPYWMEYDENKSVLRSKGNVPQDIEYSQLIIQAEGEAGVILEKVTLSITGEKTPEDVDIKQDRGEEEADERTQPEVEMTSYTEGETASLLRVTLMPSPSNPSTNKNRQDSKEPTAQRKQERLASPSLVATDSPLMSGRTATSSVTPGDSQENPLSNKEETSFRIQG